MNFNQIYINGIRTVEQAVDHALSVVSPGLLAAAVEEARDTLLTELRSILTDELHTLIDSQNLAAEWNSAIETAKAVVNGELA